ncbi:hypothetical protein THTE_2709 [Thermogutta terrifontis]|uniref:Uncharacterized protein n=1 Tax=Thermogutta terrifontis TaxID=1331910 RepID=A0A286RH65_9BACT|nr:hypothetical protein THTE_2709 [Thermogutta terrifontis]
MYPSDDSPQTTAIEEQSLHGGLVYPSDDSPQTTAPPAVTEPGT